MTLSRPALLYVFAERVLPRARIPQRLDGKRIARSAGSGSPVFLGPLEQWLVAWALAELADSGAELSLLDPSSRLHAGRIAIGAGTLDGDPAPTLAGSFRPHLPPSPESVATVISTWGDSDETLPMDGVLRHVWDELLDSDLPTSTTKPTAWQRWAFNHQLPGVRVPPTDLERPWTQALKAWTALDDDLSRTLLRQCGKGLSDLRGVPSGAIVGPPPGP